jgi:23S rRNA pseudouridine2605 synthase
VRTERVTDAVSLARALSKLGYCSRAEGERIVRAGRVAVDDRIVRDPTVRIDLRRARIAVDGVAIKAPARAYLMMYKPAGIVTTAADERGRRTVYDLLPAGTPRVNAVGRLDMDSEGLLLFTNDTRWADRIGAPASRLDKVYEVQLDRVLTPEHARQAEAGVAASRGEVLRFKHVRRLRRAEEWIEVVLDEGRNRQIRRVLEALGYEVQRLVRTRIGGLELGDLPPGGVRALTAKEATSLLP